MKVLGAVLVVLLSDDILRDGMSFRQVLQCCLRGDLTLWEREEPAFGLNAFVEFHESILRVILSA
jgi:hypothetical protein